MVALKLRPRNTVLAKLSLESKPYDATPALPDERIYASWLSRAHLFATGGLLVIITITLALGFIQFERQSTRAETRAQLLRLAKAMDNQTNASLGAVETMLLMLANSEQGLIDTRAPGHMDALFAGIVRSYPQLRSISIVSESGKIEASTTPSNLGIGIDFSTIVEPPASKGKVVIGSMLHIRDLVDLQRKGTDLSKLNVLPMLVRLNTPRGNGVLLLALVNADYFSSEYESTASDASVRVALTDFHGKLLVATDNVRRSPDSSIGHLPAYTDFLPQREWGSYIDKGIDDAHVITAFSTLKQWPLVVIVEVSYADAMKEVRVLEKGVIALVVVICLAIAILTYSSSRSLKRHAAIRKQLTLNVYASEARHNAVLESSLDGVITVNEKGHIVAFNPAAERIFGCSKAERMGKPMSTLLTPVGLQQIQQLRHSGADLESSNLRMETTALRCEGEAFPIELSILSVRVDGNLFFTVNVRDISEQHRAAQEMDSLLRKYHAVATDLEKQKLALDQHAIVSIVDANDDIVYANDKLIEISGFAREDLIGKKLHAFRKPLPNSTYLDLREHLTAGKIWHGELEKLCLDGSSYWVANTSVPVLDDAGKVRQYITIETDITDLRKTEIALKQARDREVDIGNRIQQTLLSASPEHQLSGLWFSHYNQASKGIDGDFVDVIRLGNQCTDLIVGDVMGKGVPAALLGAATKLQFSRSLAELLADPRRGGALPEPQAIVRAVHDAMTPHLQVLEAFVTLAYIRIDLEKNLITWVGCGHEESLVIHARGDCTLLPNQHPPLGILNNSEYSQDSITLAPTDIVFLCSDGLSDAIGADGQRLGRDYINAAASRIVREHPTPIAALQSLRRELLGATVQLTDDVTMALIMRPNPAHQPNRCELPITLSSIRKLRQFTLDNFSQPELDPAHAMMFELASVEVFTNILRHGQGLMADAALEVIAQRNAQELVLDIIYLGDAFTPVPENTEPDLAEFPEGGFGLSIIRNACSSVEFLHHQGVNTVRLKRFTAMTQ